MLYSKQKFKIKPAISFAKIGFAVFFVGLIFLMASEVAWTTLNEPQTGLPTQTVVIETEAGVRHTFEAEFATTAQTRTLGLMHRKHMNINQGMLFDFHVAKGLTFWMKNTYISLDILFINAKGRIIHIARQTTPLSLAPISSKGEARWVFEINGGLSELLGITSGSQLHLKRK